MTSPTAESAPREVLSLPRRTFTDPNWLQDQADARAYRISVGQLRAFKRRHQLPLDQRLSPDARDLLARAQALQLIAQRATTEAAAALAAVIPPRVDLFTRETGWLHDSQAEGYLLNRVEALTGKAYATAGHAWQRAAALAPAAAPAAPAERFRRLLFWGVVLRLDQIEGPPPADPAAFYRWSQLEAYSHHGADLGRSLGDLLAGRMGSGDARSLLELPESGPLEPAAIRSAYRAQARQHHPDAGGDPQRFEQLTAARDRLLLEVA